LCQPTLAADSGARLVCNCNKVSEADLCAAIEQGCDSVEALGATTKAGTGCGSCKNDLAQLLARTPKKHSLPLVAAS
jgi:nitrite reductase (NADH) large subunit